MSNVHKYLRISMGRDGKTEVRFEHFTEKEELEKELKKFCALAQKLGIPLRIVGAEIEGQPIPEGVEHRDFLKEGE